MNKNRYCQLPCAPPPDFVNVSGAPARLPVLVGMHCNQRCGAVTFLVGSGSGEAFRLRLRLRIKLFGGSGSGSGSE